MSVGTLNLNAGSRGRPFRSLFTTQRVTSGPYAEPMHINEAKLQTRQTGDDQDLIFSSLITTARNAVESDTSRALVYQTRTLTLDEWPDRIELYASPVRAVSIAYTDTAGAAQTLATSVYKTRLDLEPATISLKSGQYWPSVLGESGSIAVTMVCGYAVPFTVDPATDFLTFTDYSPTNGDSFRLSNSGGVLPSPLNVNTLYYVVNQSGSTCKLALTAGGTAIDLTNVGLGTHFLGVIPGWAMTAMRLLVARHYVDREGSMAASQCEASYLQAIRPGKYTFN